MASRSIQIIPSIGRDLAIAARARGASEKFKSVVAPDRPGPYENAYSQKFSNSKFSQVEKNSIRKPCKTSHEPRASEHERSEPDPQQAKTICIVAWQARAPDIIATQADADTASCRSWPSGVLAEPRKTPMLGYAFRADAIPKLRFPAPAMPRLSFRRQRESA